MIIVFWITFIGIIVVSALILISIEKIKRKPRWGLVPTDNLRKDVIDIATPSGTVKGYVYESTDSVSAGNDPFPGIVVLPRRDMRYPFFEHWGAHFALQGFTTLCIDTFDKKSPYDVFVARMASAWPAIKAELVKRKNVDPAKLVLFGECDSAEAAIHAGGSDQDVRLICTYGMREIDEHVSASAKGKVVLGFCKDDEQVPVAQFHANKQKLGAGDHDYLLLDYGGHNMLSQEAVFSAFFSIKVHERLKPVYRQVEKQDVEGVA